MGRVLCMKVTVSCACLVKLVKAEIGFVRGV